MQFHEQIYIGTDKKLDTSYLKILAGILLVDDMISLKANVCGGKFYFIVKVFRRYLNN